jgi:tetratricopeptide (TPR) repeat protein
LRLGFFSAIFQRCFWLYAVVGMGLAFFLRETPAKTAVRVTHLGYLRQAEGIIVSALRGEMKVNLEATYHQAIEYYEKLLGFIGPVDIAYGNLGFCYYSLGNPKKALKMYDKAVVLNSNYYWYYWDQGMIYSELGQNDQAIACLKKSIDLMPVTFDFYVGLTKDERMRKMIGEQALAQDFILFSERMLKDKRLAFVRLGEIFMSMGRPDLVVAMADSAGSLLEASPGSDAQEKIKLHLHADSFSFYFITLKVFMRMGSL